MSDIRASIVNFSKYLTKTCDKNKDVIRISKVISSTKLKLKEINETNESMDRINKKITSLGKEIKNDEEKNKKLLEEIEKIRKSRSYVENLKKQEGIKSQEKTLENEIYKLKEMIDFKNLSNIFHTNKEKLDIIRAHKGNFLASFQKDNGTTILSLLDKSKLNNETISSKIKQINDKKEDITQNAKTIEKDETKNLLSKTKEIKLSIEDLNNEKEKELKRYNKLKTIKGDIINSVKSKLNELNVILVDV